MSTIFDDYAKCEGDFSSPLWKSWDLKRPTVTTCTGTYPLVSPKRILTKQEWKTENLTIAFEKRVDISKSTIRPFPKYDPETGKKNKPETTTIRTPFTQVTISDEKGENKIVMRQDEFDALKNIFESTKYIFKQQQ